MKLTLIYCFLFICSICKSNTIDTTSLFSLKITDTIIKVDRLLFYNRNYRIKYFTKNNNAFTGISIDTVMYYDFGSLANRQVPTVQYLIINNGFLVCEKLTQDNYLINETRYSKKDHVIQTQKLFQVKNHLTGITKYNQNNITEKTFGNYENWVTKQIGYYDEYNQFISLKFIEYEFSNSGNSKLNKVCKTISRSKGGYRTKTRCHLIFKINHRNN